MARDGRRARGGRGRAERGERTKRAIVGERGLSVLRCEWVSALSASPAFIVVVVVVVVSQLLLKPSKARPNRAAHAIGLDRGSQIEEDEQDSAAAAAAERRRTRSQASEQEQELERERQRERERYDERRTEEVNARE